MNQTQGRVVEELELRRAAATDLVAVGTFLAGLSTQTSYRRFFAGVGVPSMATVRMLVLPGGRSGAFVAVTSDAAVVGHALWAAVGERPDVVELALVVADRLQDRGIGTALAAAAACDAAASGAGRLRLHVLAENRRAVDAVTRRWPWVRPERHGCELRYEVPLAAAERRADAAGGAVARVAERAARGASNPQGPQLSPPGTL